MLVTSQVSYNSSGLLRKPYSLPTKEGTNLSFRTAGLSFTAVGPSVTRSVRFFDTDVAVTVLSVLLLALLLLHGTQDTGEHLYE